MFIGKTVIAGSALVAILTLSNALERLSEASIFVPKPVAANAAVVDDVAQIETESKAAGAPTRFGRAKDGLFYVHATVNGMPVKFVLDTGATLVVLTAQDARRLGLSGTSAGVTDSMETAAGTSSIARVTLDRIKVAGHSVDDVEAAVVPRGLKTSLLGQNLLAQLGPITLSANEAELH